MAQQIPIILTDKETTLSVEKRGLALLLLTAMRPHQWTKNLFIFAPLLFGRKLTEPEAVGQALLAFVVFSFLASALYIFNDWMDAEEDRAHPEKRNRPISSGALPLPIAFAGAIMLFIAAVWIALAGLGVKFFLIAALYFILTLSYCLALKRMIVLDCMTIAAGFVLRVVGGAVAVSVVPYTPSPSVM